MPERTIKQPAARLISELWWLWLLQAMSAVIFGAVATFWPGLTLAVLVYLIAVFVIVIGIIETVRSLSSVTTRSTWWMSLIVGVLTFGVGIYLARHPGVTFSTFVLVVGIAFIAWGVIDLMRAFFEPLSPRHQVLSFIAGLAAVGAGIVTLFQPAAGGLAFVWVFGLFAFIYGVSALVMAIEHYHDYLSVKSSLEQ